MKKVPKLFFIPNKLFYICNNKLKLIQMLNKGSGYKDKELQKYRKDLAINHDIAAILKDYLTKENLPQSLANISILRWECGKDARIDGILVDDIIHNVITN